MYDRAPRVLSRSCGSTAPGVGPGSYHTNKKLSGESYAPFLSMSVRESFLTINESLAAAPGPGHYAPGFAFQKTKGGCSLDSRAERFMVPPSKAPGPGAYTISKSTDWIRKTYPPANNRPSTSRNTTKIGHVTYHRLPTAPSIPMPGQNYGYDEDGDGVLKPQKLPSKDSTIGPAYYNVRHDDTVTTKKYRGIHFGNYKSQRTKFRGRDGPGPGDYNPSFGASDNALKKQADGEGGQPITGYLPRYHELVTHIEEKKAVPGPGQYEIKSQFENKSTEEDDPDLEHAKVPFGSRLQRFLTPKHSSPACTTYEDPRTALESTKRLTGLGKTPFGQTSARFRVNRQAKLLPGPGTYNDSQVTSLATELTKKAMLQGIQKHPFSSTSVRTAPLVKMDELDMPGPAHYQKGTEDYGENHEGIYKKPLKSSHMFSSTTGRLYTPPKIVTDIPPPGSYEVSESHTKSQGKAEPTHAGTSHSVFLSSAERFAPPRDILLEEPDAFNPGPGEYESPVFVGKAKTGMICSKEGRFKPIKSQVPGPGAYEMRRSQRDTLLQGTFNASLDNPLGEDQSSHKPSSGKKRTAFVLGV